MSRPTKIDGGPKAQGIPGKVSEMILEFARPLLDAIGPPGRIEDLRAAFELVTTCWNLPILHRKQLPEWDQHQRHFDSVVATSPKPVVPILLGLVESRKTTFGQIPFMVLVEVRDTSLDNCTIYAEARGSSAGQFMRREAWTRLAASAASMRALACVTYRSDSTRSNTRRAWRTNVCASAFST